MTEDHEQFAGWSASYVLGALDSVDRRAFESHLARCPACTTELNEMAPLPSLLAKVDPNLLEQQPSVATADRISELAARELNGLQRRHRIWRAAAVASTAAAVVFGALLLFSPEGSGDGPANPNQQQATVLSSEAAETTVVVIPKGWGTEIVLNIADLPRRDRYQLWTIDDDGGWTNAASWAPTQSGGVRLTGASSVPLDNVDRIVITSLDRNDVLVEASG